MSEDTYQIGAFITGVLIFGGVWLYSMAEWGFLFGLALGWIPALIAGVIGGFLWPLLALLLLWVFLANR